MLTPDGAELLLSLAAGLSDDTLAAPTIEVSDGGQTAAAAMDDGFPQLAVDAEGDATLLLQATFGADVANFEWSVRRILSRDGIAVDETAEDLGRKAGAVWTLQATLELACDEETDAS